MSVNGTFASAATWRLLNRTNFSDVDETPCGVTDARYLCTVNPSHYESCQIQNSQKSKLENAFGLHAQCKGDAQFETLKKKRKGSSWKKQF